MEGYLEILLDALLDTLKMVPILLIVYLLIEFLEYKKVFSFENSKFLKGKASPLFGTLFGCVPQCGFSVISTDLFSKGKMSIGALIAVYIATSDEALPIMLSNPTRILDLIELIGVKLIMGISIGYIAMGLYKLLFNKTKQEEHNEAHDEEHHEEVVHKGCCHHEMEKSKYNWVHPVLHSLKIAAFVLIANIVFGVIVYLIGQEKIETFLQQSYALQPLVSVLIGLIPNCVSSVILTQLYLAGGISFGAIISGLSVNAGLGLLMLIKQNKNVKENIFIFSVLIISSLIFGYALHYII